VPPQATSLLRGVLRQATLEPLTELTTTRRRLIVHDAQGRPCGEIDDDTVTVVGGGGDGRQFRQLEVEWRGGPSAVLDAVLHRLEKAGARLSNEPKLAIALGQAPGPAPSATGRLGPRARLGGVIEASITDALGRLLDHDYVLRTDPDDPASHAVHQARVATRRLRSDLKTMRAALDPEWLDHTRAELKWLGGVLGKVRDLDVLAGHLEEDIRDVPGGGAELRGQLDQQRRSAIKALSEALVSSRYLDLLDSLSAASHGAPFAAIVSSQVHPQARAGKVLPGLVGRQWRTLRHRVNKAGKHPTDGQLHRIRIGAKQLRYASELADPVIGPKARRTAKAAENLQTVLGEHHDAVAADQWLRNEVPHLSGAGSFTAGRLSVPQEKRQARLRRRWTSDWKALETDKTTHWLR
jgi:CHAD domain-containing protein